MLREQVLGKDRFDKAFRVYTERWALNIPHQMIFRTIENVSGEDLNWFWRAWFVNIGV
jgi:aminopeptidase N